MLQHDWMRSRDRRARRLDRDGEPLDPEQAAEEEGPPEEDMELSPSPFLFDEEPADEDQAVETEASASADETTVEQEATVEEPAAAEPLAHEAAPEPPQAAQAPDPEPEPEPAEAVAEPEPAETAAEPEPEPVTEAPAAEDMASEPESEEAAAPSRPTAKEVAAGIDVPLRTMQDRLEQVLAGQNQLPLDIDARQEVSARADSTPSEQRLELVQRLLDPTLNLREVATLLDVCTTTVRRYTDRGVLRCFRTPGNQRRFNLSDVLDFMERQQRGEV